MYHCFSFLYVKENKVAFCLKDSFSKSFSFISTDTDVVERQVFNKGSPCIFKGRLDSTAIGLALAAANRATRKPDKSLKGLPGLINVASNKLVSFGAYDSEPVIQVLCVAPFINGCPLLDGEAFFARGECSRKKFSEPFVKF